MAYTVLCFGEILWDLLPAGAFPGGAPMNVAIHLRQLGIRSGIVSRVGQDEWGKKLTAFIRDKGLDTGLIQQDPQQPTGLVQADVSRPDEIRYEIAWPAAWDFIEADEALQQAVQAAEWFLYGSLASRSEGSRQALQALLPLARRRAMDVNLRPPYDLREVLEPLLRQAHLVKMNEYELAKIAAWHSINKGEEAQAQALMAEYGWETLCITRGGEGAWLFHAGQFFQQAAFPITVKDTIGSGDSFLAALLQQLLDGRDAAEALRFACAVGAYVATQPGATPALAPEHIAGLFQL